LILNSRQRPSKKQTEYSTNERPKENSAYRQEKLVSAEKAVCMIKMKKEEGIIINRYWAKKTASPVLHFTCATQSKQ
jgi:hypothetical protein